MECRSAARASWTRGLAGLGLVLLGVGLVGAADVKSGAPDPKAARKAPVQQPAVASTLHGTRLDSQALARHIDRALDARLKADRVTASPLADDAEFLRRVALDLTGRIPSLEKTRAFLASTDPNRRAKVIDELLDSPDYGRHMADIWQALLLPRDSMTRRFPSEGMVKWLEESFNRNKAWDQLVRDLLTASGDVTKNQAVTYYLYNRTADKLTDNSTRLFLGVQLQCAQCHNHPFTGWKQDEYWNMAAFFMKVRFDGNPRQAVQNGGTISISESGRGRPPMLPESARMLPPKFLQGEQPALSDRDPYRPVLAAWLTTPANPFFSKAMVNRMWAHLFGRGFVAPVDDMHDANPASHPELLADLADQFAANGFDLKHLLRGLCNSQAYQRTSRPHGGNDGAAPELFARMAVKVLTPEQLFDSFTQVLGAPQRPAFAGRGPQAGRFGPATPRAAFVAFFQIEEGADPTEYQAGIPQALRLMNGPAFNNLGRLGQALSSDKSPVENLETLYLSTLTRKPRPEEIDRLTAYLGKSAEPRQAWADILWAVLNTSEFTLNH